MKLTEAPIQGLYIIEPKVFEDSRGYFMETFNQKAFAEVGINVSFVQDNESCSSKGVIRGLHYQLAPFAQSKLVRVIAGEILDVALDLRLNSPTYGKHFSILLNSQSKKQLFIPHGFAHGFSVLSETAVVQYKCDSLYNPSAERGIQFNDPALSIDWMVKDDQATISPKDLVHPLFADAEKNFTYGKK
ncbi:MAG TPA: dTDP-4-dehydrorhamnose 3,5-epimerase [Tenuifilaceae bacterium]|nr:dTDP-4-dehydrorhamnose 3,5-epimerase [Tenuifilaceae bacterium]HQB77988.1 dTDP-4-dehydrorhamnose 3,5-epimerase [Tenuifilaceae bacterium]